MIQKGVGLLCGSLLRKGEVLAYVRLRTVLPANLPAGPFYGRESFAYVWSIQNLQSLNMFFELTLIPRSKSIVLFNHISERVQGLGAKYFTDFTNC